MQMNDMIIVSADDHFVEPPDMFDRHLPKKWLDRAPKCRVAPTGEYEWTFEGKHGLNHDNNAVVGRPRAELGFLPNSFHHMRKGCWDAKARLDDMNVNGVLAGINFPTFPYHSLEMIISANDKALAEAVICAFNDWHIDEWCAAGPGRFIPLVSLPLWDSDLAIKELRRNLRRGAHAINFPAFPNQQGLPSLQQDFWRPFLKAINDEGVVICVHCGAGGGTEAIAPDSPIDALNNKRGLSCMSAATEWLWSPWPREFDDLKILMSEGDIGWIPYMTGRADQTYRNHSAWTHQNFGKKWPSEVFREHFYASFIEDLFGLEVRNNIGVETITFECDYPHADVTWPHSPERLWEDFRKTGCSDREVDMITHENALKLFQFDPFSVLDRKACTVGALRAQGAGVDMSPVTGGIAPPVDKSRVVTWADAAAQLNKRLPTDGGASAVQ